MVVRCSRAFHSYVVVLLTGVLLGLGCSSSPPSSPPPDGGAVDVEDSSPATDTASSDTVADASGIRF